MIAHSLFAKVRFKAFQGAEEGGGGKRRNYKFGVDAEEGVLYSSHMTGSKGTSLSPFGGMVHALQRSVAVVVVVHRQRELRRSPQIRRSKSTSTVYLVTAQLEWRRSRANRDQNSNVLTRHGDWHASLDFPSRSTKGQRTTLDTGTTRFAMRRLPLPPS